VARGARARDVAGGRYRSDATVVSGAVPARRGRLDDAPAGDQSARAGATSVTPFSCRSVRFGSLAGAALIFYVRCSGSTAFKRVLALAQATVTNHRVHGVPACRNAGNYAGKVVLAEHHAPPPTRPMGRRKIPGGYIVPADETVAMQAKVLTEDRTQTRNHRRGPHRAGARAVVLRRKRQGLAEGRGHRRCLHRLR